MAEMQQEAWILFMGEEEDLELSMWHGRGLRIYGALDGRGPPLGTYPRRPPPESPLPFTGFWVDNGGHFVRCGCGRCFHGPCPTPKF